MTLMLRHITRITYVLMSWIFLKSCIKGGQDLTFYRVGAHHQNYVVESKIREVCYSGRTMLLHARLKCSSMISIEMRPYVVQAIIERLNRLLVDEDRKTPIENSLA